MRDWQQFAVAAERHALIVARMRERWMPEMTEEDAARIRAFLAGGGVFLAVGNRAFMRHDLEGLVE